MFECPAIKEFFYRLPGKPIRRLSTNQEIATLDGNISLSRCGQFVKGPRKYLDLATGKEHYGWNAESGTIARIPMVNENYLKKIKRVAIDSNRIILETRRGVYFEFRYVTRSNGDKLFMLYGDNPISFGSAKKFETFQIKLSLIHI